ncbi:uncharacterized protein LOC110878189 [Helianthus annuus]|uniref:uncharacterized protein LOC110878189 n=1 Tax=Helianthus annuus TaxID=4232 RepID=UPI000B8F89A9|nr:uncharacterized protein LOC110878189 [Helianthus annuus]
MVALDSQRRRDMEEGDRVTMCLSIVMVVLDRSRNSSTLKLSSCWFLEVVEVEPRRWWWLTEVVDDGGTAAGVHSGGDGGAGRRQWWWFRSAFEASQVNSVGSNPVQQAQFGSKISVQATPWFGLTSFWFGLATRSKSVNKSQLVKSQSTAVKLSDVST